MKPWRAASLLVSAIAAQPFFIGTGKAQAVLDFETISDAQISSQYGNQGVTFDPVPLQSYATGFARSGRRAIELCFAAEFCTAQLVARFTAGQSSVRIYVGTSYGPNVATPVVMTALDANGAVVGTASTILGPSNMAIPVSSLLAVTSGSANIREIRVGGASPGAYNNGLVFDDLTLSTAGPQTACATTFNPVATLLKPAPGTTVQINEVPLKGSINPRGAPLESATLTIAGPSNQSRSSDLLGSIIQPNGGPFGETKLSGSLFPGLNTLTLTARTCRGTDQKSTTVTYGPAAPNTQIRLLGMELTQVTQDMLNSVPLTAGKPTLLRLYFTTTGGPDLQFVRGDVAGYRQGGNTPFLAQSLGATTVTSATNLPTLRSTISGSMNFLLSPDFYGQGGLNFRVLRLYVDGPGGATLSCVGCANWTAGFLPMPPLNLVVQPYYYTKSSKAADSGTSLLNGLRYLNNVYPLRGDYPLDDSGLKMILLPQRTLNLNIPQDNDRVLYQLGNILDDLMADPASGVPRDAYILGVAPSGAGGVANMNSRVAYGDSRALGDPPTAADPEFYGAIWAQEIGHAFGLRHVSSSHGEAGQNQAPDPDFPYPHGSIDQPGAAIITEQWNGSPFVIPVGNPADGAPHAHDFMSYGASVSGNTFSWVSPYVYRKLRQNMIAALPAIAPMAAAIPRDKLVVGGTIDAAGRLWLAPGRIVRTAYSKGSGDSGRLTVDLLDAVGRVLRTYRFEPSPTTQGGGSTFNEYVPWDPSTRSIIIKRGNEVLAQRAVSSAAPTVVQAVARRAGPNRLHVEWRARDSDGDPLTYDIYFNGGQDRRWTALASGLTGTSADFDTRLLPASSSARVRVLANDGLRSGEATAPVVLPRNPPVPAIMTATTGRDGSIRLEGAAYDPIGGLVSGGQLRWSSDRDGDLGAGRALTLARLSRGTHLIRLTASGPGGRAVATRRLVVP